MKLSKWGSYPYLQRWLGVYLELQKGAFCKLKTLCAWKQPRVAPWLSLQSWLPY